MKIGKKIIEWDGGIDALESEVKYRVQNWNEFDYDEQSSEEQVRDDIYNSDYFFEDEWESFLDCFRSLLEGKYSDLKTRRPVSYWKVKVNNFGWRSLNGFKIIEACNEKEFLSEILPDCDCNFKIFNYGRGLAIQNFHHDSPVGNEWYYATPIKSSTFYKLKN